MAERNLLEIIRHRRDFETDQHGYRDHPDYFYRNVTFDTRAFLWELVAAFDLTLFWMKERFNLDLDAHKITWEAVESKCKNTDDPKCAAAFAEVMRIHNGDWFSAVTLYRKYAHRSFFFFTQGLLGGGRYPQGLTSPSVEGSLYLEGLNIILADYLDDFKSYVTRLTPLME